MSKFYTDEKNALAIIALLKAHGIRKVIASPGTTNMALVCSIHHDPYFQVYSSVDERSAAYMACGLAHESGEPVVISCTGATASRNYMPGLTEAYYRKLPILAVTSTQMVGKVGHHIPQVIDRSVKPADTYRFSVELPIVKDDDDWWECEVKVNQAILELKRGGGGPVHINLPTRYSRAYDTKTLPTCRVMNRFNTTDKLPELKGRVAVFIGAHRPFTAQETEVLDRFCGSNNAVVFCDHTSCYKGKYRLLYSLAASQDQMDLATDKPDVTIHIGEVTGDYAGMAMVGKEVWRVSEDGEIRDTFRKLRYVFEMDEKTFFERYTESSKAPSDQYLKCCQARLKEVQQEIPEVPFSNIWVAQQTAHKIPESSVVHFGILNSLRSWNFFELPKSVTSMSNVGGFGIDGGLSSLLGASLANPNKFYFCIIGDLAFFYDMNSLGNRHVGNNMRIMVINNGKGTEFRQYNHVAAHFGDQADEFISASGHYGNKSPTLIKHYAQDLGFKYLCASSKEEYTAVYPEFLATEAGVRPLVFEVFTNSEEESRALEMIRNIKRDYKKSAKAAARRVLGDRSVGAINKFLKG
ncbi:2-succinyl-5-enolpyruvyl-6-hydroxy-3-cyclohexene-1-carboxylate synthase [Marinobacter nauticus]|uniref:2-succinyl-5-enolpyruvyl-6-hydroxy-3- cyclohexene-1-carboxylate synthase n=1 Tax=Marinobacter nauticus TaxID=2743 RepID=UPI001C99CA3A|nr:thiamine pyrophosphate-binding protein [Marinobacter nauticus]MBY5937705.1 2-succinyl-5-enolpyruvyl-6-hydroxy-3-cyclohexene-1-carboxylate synthase [Marinobacter nauticus]MBY5954933.1 2-succinyl-5-enolpyruvyl-6-hydroxy-3-cyclohexene-1-carboxylate synthase [Marinobacter nauticus]MBY6008726.1 2-succinyl-5-enolpyruvyl-6-hydroxy-3-cyclohexene-1-carboxylate synthase [Marinobacter nauticus]